MLIFFSEQRMLTAEETVCNQEANMQKLMHELESKDAELEELVMNIEEMESRGAELEGLVQLLEVRKKFQKILLFRKFESDK